MYEEQKMIAAGVPFSEVLGLCASNRRAKAFGRMDHEEHHTCKCGGSGNCPDCPNKNK